MGRLNHNQGQLFYSFHLDVFAIRSERMLCREVKVNLAYRWFCAA